VLAIFFGERVQAQPLGRKIDADVIANRSAVLDSTEHASAFDSLDAKLDLSIAEQDAVAGVDVGCERGVIDRERRRIALGTGYERDGLPALERARTAAAAPDFRPRKILENRDRFARAFAFGPNQAQNRGVLGVRPVRKIQARDVHARADELSD